MLVILNLEAVAATRETVSPEVLSRYDDVCGKMEAIEIAVSENDVETLNAIYHATVGFVGADTPTSTPTDAEGLRDAIFAVMDAWEEKVLTEAVTAGWKFSWDRALESVYQGYKGRHEGEVGETKRRYQRLTWAVRLLRMIGTTDQRLRNFLLWIIKDAILNEKPGQWDAMDLITNISFDPEREYFHCLKKMEVSDAAIEALGLIPVLENSGGAVYDEIRGLADVYRDYREVLHATPGNCIGGNAFEHLAEDFTQLITGQKMKHFATKDELKAEGWCD